MLLLRLLLPLPHPRSHVISMVTSSACHKTSKSGSGGGHQTHGNGARVTANLKLRIEEMEALLQDTLHKGEAAAGGAKKRRAHTAAPMVVSGNERKILKTKLKRLKKQFKREPHKKRRKMTMMRKRRRLPVDVNSIHNKLQIIT
jgi:hypothetical protein